MERVGLDMRVAALVSFAPTQSLFQHALVCVIYLIMILFLCKLYRLMIQLEHSRVVDTLTRMSLSLLFWAPAQMQPMSNVHMQFPNGMVCYPNQEKWFVFSEKT